ncbi:MAG: hypothetical protein ACREP8_02875, partial [Candidatus Binatia bacterium]
VEEIAAKLADLPGLHDKDAAYILAKAEELDFDLANIPPSPTPEVYRFLVHISPKLQKAIESWFNTDAAGTGEAIRGALVEGLQALYGEDKVQIDTTSKHCGDDIRWMGSAYDVVRDWDYRNYSPITAGDYDTYVNALQMIDGDG